jgi:hypothetical protein
MMMVFLAAWLAVGLVLLTTLAWLGFLGRLLSEEPLCEPSSCCCESSSLKAQRLLKEESLLSGEALSSSQERSSLS